MSCRATASSCCSSRASACATRCCGARRSCLLACWRHRHALLAPLTQTRWRRQRWQAQESRLTRSLRREHQESGPDICLLRWSSPFGAAAVGIMLEPDSRRPGRQPPQHYQSFMCRKWRRNVRRLYLSSPRMPAEAHPDSRRGYKLNDYSPQFHLPHPQAPAGCRRLGRRSPARSASAPSPTGTAPVLADAVRSRRRRCRASPTSSSGFAGRRQRPVKAKIEPAADDGCRRSVRRSGRLRQPARRSSAEAFFSEFRGDGDQNGHGERRFGHRDRNDDQPRPVAQGSGFFISETATSSPTTTSSTDGQPSPSSSNDGKELDAKLIGTDPRTDLAVLKVDGGGKFTYVDFADDAKVRVGDWVVAVGNPFGLGGTVTAGIVSARGRDIGAGPYDDFIQIDAAVNRGNSGGPTFNLNGEVVGINTAIFSPSGGNVGIAFAIPASTAKRRRQRPDEETARSTRGWLGVADPAGHPGHRRSRSASKAPRARWSPSAQDDGPGQKAGIKAGDVDHRGRRQGRSTTPTRTRPHDRRHCARQAKVEVTVLARRQEPDRQGRRSASCRRPTSRPRPTSSSRRPAKAELARPISA